ncbi:MAG: DUF2750 domain-containing protein [Bacteroidota bacterium]
MDSNKLEAYKSLSPEDLYQNFVENVAQMEAMWGLYDEKNDGWAMTVSEGEKERLVVWSDSALANSHASGGWKTYEMETMDLYGFVESGIQELKDAGRGISIMYLQGLGGLDVDLDYLKRDLLDAVRAIHGEDAEED